MKYFKFWVREVRDIRVGDKRQTVTVVAGSNVSKEDASANAGKIAAVVEERIQNPKRNREAYEACIKEHIVQEIDSSNIVTVTRYGAHVLNTTKYTILDIDNYRPSFFDLFRKAKGNTKDKIVGRFKQRIARHPELGVSFRIYETCKGVRIIGKDYFDPQAKNFLKVMRSLDVDTLYCWLSRKQNCYRARLTPKPYRMKMETIRIKTPLDCETEAYGVWQKKYAENSQRYSVVKLREVIGKDFGNDPVIMFHDQMAGMRSDCPLA